MISTEKKKKIDERCKALEKEFERRYKKETEVEKNMFEDGKLFYMEEMNEKEMFEKMIEEIEG